MTKVTERRVLVRLSLIQAKDAEIARLTKVAQFKEDIGTTLFANLDAKDAEIAALKTSLAAIRDCLPAAAQGSELEGLWASAVAAPECVLDYVLACAAAQHAEIAALRKDALRYRWLRSAADATVTHLLDKAETDTHIDALIDAAMAQAVQQ